MFVVVVLLHVSPLVQKRGRVYWLNRNVSSRSRVVIPWLLHVTSNIGKLEPPKIEDSDDKAAWFSFTLFFAQGLASLFIIIVDRVQYCPFWFLILQDQNASTGG